LGEKCLEECSEMTENSGLLLVSPSLDFAEKIEEYRAEFLAVRRTQNDEQASRKT